MLPQAILNFLEQSAKSARVKLPVESESLFRAGVLDSFSLVEFVTVIEKTCGITVDDDELRPENFDTIDKVTAYISRAQN